MTTLVGHVTSIAPYLSPALISPTCFKRIESLAKTLPDSSLVIFESKLSEYEPVVDFSVCLLAAEGNHKQLVDILERKQTVYSGPIWSHIRQLGTQWINENTSLYNAVENLWLEYDVSQQISENLLPGVFVGIHTPYRQTYPVGKKIVNSLLEQKSAAERLPLIQKSYNFFEPTPEPANHFVPGIFQIGVMLSRGSTNVRLCHAFSTILEIKKYLQHMGWPGEWLEIEPLLMQLYDIVDEVALHIEVGTGVSQKIGFELFNHAATYQQRKVRWEDILNYFVEKGLCLPEKRVALLDWIGIKRDDSPIQTGYWKNRIIKTDTVRRINHLKCVYEPGHPLQIKAYFASRKVKYASKIFNNPQSPTKVVPT